MGFDESQKGTQRSGIDILMFCFTDNWYNWERDGFPSRRSRIAKKLGEHPGIRKLLIVNVPSSIFASLANVFGKSKNAKKSGTTIKTSTLFELRQINSNVYTFDHTRFLPRERHHSLSFKLNNLLSDTYLTRAINEVLNELDMPEAVLWFNGPLPVHFINDLNNRPIIYDAADEWLFHPAHQGMKKEIEASYNAIRAEADAVFAVTEDLVRTFSGGKPEVHLVPNGVDPERFMFSDDSPPADIAQISKPIAGYVGALQERIDVDLMLHITKSTPEIAFVFIGPMLSRDHFKSLADINNVYFLGFKNQKEIPRYIRSFDVCIMPHVDSGLTRNMDPVKLYEYLAAERPIITTDLQSLNCFGDLIRRASTTEEFAKFIHEAILGNWQLDLVAARRFVEENTWNARIERMVNTVQEFVYARSERTS